MSKWPIDTESSWRPDEHLHRMATRCVPDLSADAPNWREVVRAYLRNHTSWSADEVASMTVELLRQALATLRVFDTASTTDGVITRMDFSRPPQPEAPSAGLASFIEATRRRSQAGTVSDRVQAWCEASRLFRQFIELAADDGMGPAERQSFRAAFSSSQIGKALRATGDTVTDSAVANSRYFRTQVAPHFPAKGGKR